MGYSTSRTTLQDSLQIAPLVSFDIVLEKKDTFRISAVLREYSGRLRPLQQITEAEVTQVRAGLRTEMSRACIQAMLSQTGRAHECGCR